MFCHVVVGGVNRIDDKSRLSETENFKTEHVYFLAVLSSLKMQCEQDLGAYAFTPQMWLHKTDHSPNILKTIETLGVCCQLCLYHRHDKTRQSCFVSCVCQRCELGIKSALLLWFFWLGNITKKMCTSNLRDVWETGLNYNNSRCVVQLNKKWSTLFAGCFCYSYR